MNGAHDMGGSHGFGPVVPEVREPTFQAEWERRVFALTMAAGRPGKWNIDMGRFARENRPPQRRHAAAAQHAARERTELASLCVLV